MSSERALSALASAVCHNPWRVLLGVLLLVLLTASGAGRLQFSNDYKAYFAKDNPELVAFEAMQSNFTRSDSVLIVVEPLSGNVFSRESLALIRTITEKAWQLPYSTRVDSLTNHQHSVARGDELIVGDLVAGTDGLDDSDLATIRAAALSEPMLVNRLVSPQGHVAGINVIIRLPYKDPAEAMVVADATRALRDEVLQQFPEARIHLTGLVMINSAFGDAAEHDMNVLGPIMFSVIMIGLLLLLRSWGAMAATLLLILFSIATAMGAAGWLGWRLTPTSALAPTIIMTMAVADCVHLMVTCLYGMSRGLARMEAMQESIRINFQPILVTSITTAIGFLSLNFSDSPPFHVLGNIVAIGVVIAFLLAITLLPALLMLLPLHVHTGEYGWGRKMAGFSEFVIARQRQLLWVNGIVALLLIAMLPLNQLNDEFIKYFDKSVPFRQATDFTNQNLTGIYTLEYVLEAGESGGISEPLFLQQVEAFAQRLRQHPDVLHVYVLTDTLKRLNRNMHADDDSYYLLPDSREMAAQYLLLYEMSLPYGLDLNDQVNIDKSAMRVVVSLQSVPTSRVLELEREFSGWLAANAPGISAEAVSPTLMFSHIGQSNIRRMLAGTVVALVAISLILVAALRSLRMGLISLLPNLLPAGMAFGIWALIDGRIGLSLSVVAGMTLGIVVDDTVHFLSKYQRARRVLGLPAEDAVRYAFSSVGIALWVTSLVLVAGFLVLLSSDFVQSSGMGLMTAITIAVALFMDFLFLPPLLIRLDSK